MIDFDGVSSCTSLRAVPGHGEKPRTKSLCEGTAPAFPAHGLRPRYPCLGMLSIVVRCFGLAPKEEAAEGTRLKFPVHESSAGLGTGDPWLLGCGRAFALRPQGWLRVGGGRRFCGGGRRGRDLSAMKPVG
jgi:hypothetical protein